ncbi:MAG: UDP-N-acetylglucosamine 2-epimerase (non-hydrolyzing) [Rikenellaceae bacterium]
MKKKVLVVFGTRPEAIKMAPIVKTLQKYSSEIETKVCVTAQHREMLDQVLEFFNLNPDYDLDLMHQKQSLNSITANILLELKGILEDFKPDMVLVHGDTATSTAAALAAFYAQCSVAHVEAGLRTWNKLAPFPEELNRQLTSRIADIHFAPTEQARQNLLLEGIKDSDIIVTGNTVIDALFDSLEILNSYDSEEINDLESIIKNEDRVILVTGHRRENFGDGFINICNALKIVAERNPDVKIIYPVHLNPQVQEPANKILSGIDNISLISPLKYPSFVWLMKRSELIITDSGGVQEEAPSLGKPVLVMRDVTERPEAIAVGTVKLVGTDINKIVESAEILLNDKVYYNQISCIKNPYGDGTASQKIIDCILKIN